VLTRRLTPFLLAFLAACDGGAHAVESAAREEAPCPACLGRAPVAAEASAPAPLPEIQVAAWAGEWDPALGTATVKGVAKFDGTPRRRRPIEFAQEPHCAKVHEGREILDESSVVGEDGTVQNVFVYVKEGLDAWKFPVPAEPVVIDQIGCIYVPHVAGMQLGQKLKFRNSDPVLHNVHGQPKRNPEFNFGQTKQGMETEVDIKRAEVMIPVKCDVHGWMQTYVGVVKHPYFRVTGEGGAFELSGLPPGKFVIEAWHELYGTLSQEVEVGDKETKEIVFTFSRK
jgi:hypothetical protein